MSALLAIGWQPELRGILITIIALTTFCGSCYFLLSTNLGARLGFLVALAALAGWMFLMGATWWSYGKGLLGPDASWAPISGRTVLQTTAAVNDSGALRRAGRRSCRRRPDNGRNSGRQAVRHRWLEEARILGAGVSAGRRRGQCVRRRIGRDGQRRFRGRQRLRQGWPTVSHSCSTASSISWRSCTSRTTRWSRSLPW